MVSSKTLAVATALSTLSAVSAFNPQSKTNVAVYYGQGYDQPRLREFCQESALDIINIGFINEFPEQSPGGWPGSNFGNQCNGETYTIGGLTTKLLSGCHQIVEDIPICQAAGKKVFLSLGGASPATQQILEEETAIAFADFLWLAFGPVNQTWVDIGGPRPFGDVVVDGFDFDIEHNGGFGYADMVNRFREHYAEVPDRTFYISGAPQCPIPDAQLSDAITNSPFDFVWVQFYNNPGCSAMDYVEGNKPGFNYDAWVKVIKRSANPNAKLYVGLPASDTVVNPGYYLTPEEVEPLVEEYMKKYPETFGGIMLWEATASERNQINGGSYADSMKSILNGCAPTPSPTPSPSSTPIPSSTATPSSTPVSSTTTTTSSSAVTSSSSVVSSSSTTSSTTTSTPSSTTTSTPSSSAVPSSSAIPSSSPVTTRTPTSTPVIPTTTRTRTSSVPVIPTTTRTPTRSPSSTPTKSPSASVPGSSTPGSSAPVPSSSSSSCTDTTTGQITSATTTSSSTSVSSSSTSCTDTTTSGNVKPTTTSSSTSVSSSSTSCTDTTTSGHVKPTTTSSSAPGQSGTTTTGSGITSGPVSTPTTTTAPSTTEDSTTYTTVIVTSYTSICPTGFTTVTTTYTTTYCPGNTATATATLPPTGPGAQTSAPAPPEGWTTTVTVCTQCAATPTTVTLTLPAPTTTEAPVAPTTTATLPAGYTTTVTVCTECGPAPTTVTVTVPIVAVPTGAPGLPPGRPVHSTTSRPVILGTGGVRPSSSSSTMYVRPSSTGSRAPVAPTTAPGDVSPVFTGAAPRVVGWGHGVVAVVASLLYAFVM